MSFNTYYSKNEFNKNLILQKGNDLFEIRIIKLGINGYFTSDEDGINSLIEELKKKNLLNNKITIYQTLQNVKSDIVPHDNINHLYQTKQDQRKILMLKDINGFLLTSILYMRQILRFLILN